MFYSHKRTPIIGFLSSNSKWRPVSRGIKMKYAAFWEYDVKDEKVLIEKFKKAPEQEITRLTPAFHLGGQTKGLSLYEADDFKAVERFIQHYSPELHFVVYPILETSEEIKIRSK
jgi:hypothetical protein